MKYFQNSAPSVYRDTLQPDYLNSLISTLAVGKEFGIFSRPGGDSSIYIFILEVVGGGVN